MPKKKTLWKRETPCLVCETQMTNYQFMTKSQVIVVDEWMRPHTEAIGGYEHFPDELKTTICPKCLTASNEYSCGVEDYSRFFKSPTKNNQMKEYFENCADDRAKLLAEGFGQLEKECSVLDGKRNRPKNTRTKATIEKIWENRDQIGVPFFQKIFEEPRDLAAVVVLFTMDRYFQMVRICFNNDIEPDNWSFKTMKEAIEAKFDEESLSMKSAEPRFYYIGMNHLESIFYLEKLNKEVYDDDEQHFQELLDYHWQHAHKYFKYCQDNDDVGSIPLETKDGGLNLLLAKLHYMFDKKDDGEKCLRFAKNYADNRMKRISSTNQQNFVNNTDALFKEKIKTAEVDEGEEGEEEAS
ncbi:MAG: hypothetical protein P9L94_09120 [Candidatus Hinthialibacter antarcticus]|nr:hypothetical protein [Candidatus Hinthialibacter antarcticus]